MNDNNIIKFPQDKVKRSKGTKRSGPIIDLENRKVMVSAALLSFLFIVTLINSSIMATNNKTIIIDSRGIASVGSLNGMERNTEWEHRLAQELSEKPMLRGVASIARKPSMQDDLLIGLLQGKYSVRFKEGKISHISFSKGPDLDIKPRQLKRIEFLTSYRDMLPISFTQIERVEVNKSDDGKVMETYSIVDEKSLAKAQVVFELDKMGGMLSMKVQNNLIN